MQRPKGLLLQQQSGLFCLQQKFINNSIFERENGKKKGKMEKKKRKNVLVVHKQLCPTYCPGKECVAVGYSEQCM